MVKKGLLSVFSLVMLLVLGVFGYASYSKPPEIMTTAIELAYGDTLILSEVIATSEDVVSLDVVAGEVNTDQVGKYLISIQATNERDFSVVKELEVLVVDEEAPVIKVEKKFTTEAKEPFDLKEHVTVTDNADGDMVESLEISAFDTNVVGEEEVTLSVVDSSGNKTEEIVKLHIVDTVKPVIHAENKALTEGDSINLKQGVTAKDNIDGDITSAIEVVGEVDTKKPGTYNVTYKVQDKAGNKASKEVLVTVKEKPEPPKPITQTVQVSTSHSSNTSKTSKTTYAPMTVYFNGKAVSYKNGGLKNGQAVIDSGPFASTWGGAEVFSGTDGKNTHIIGHNPGPFAGIWNAKEIIVTDGSGTPFTYVVQEVYKLADASFTIDHTSYEGWNRVINPNKGEMITIQTCVAATGNMNYIMEAKLK